MSGEAWRGMARHGEVWRGRARQGLARRGKAWRGKVWLGKARQGEVYDQGSGSDRGGNHHRRHGLATHHHGQDFLRPGEAWHG
jgi:hypothetical protein